MRFKGMTWDHPRGYEPVVAASDAYFAKTGIEISWDRRSLQAFADEPILGLADRYDFIVLDHPHVGQIADSGALLPLPAPADLTDSLGGSMQSYLWDGAYWAYAIDTTCQMAAFRPDLGAALPEFREDFLAPDAARFRPLTPLLPVDAFDMMMTLIAGRGDEIMPHDPERFFSDESGLYALGVLRALYRLGPEEQVAMNPIRVLEAMSSTAEFACSPCLFGYVNYARPGFRTHRISYFDLPLCRGALRPRAIPGGAGIGVSANTDNPEEAISFARWLASPPIQGGVYLANEGRPASRHVWLEQAENPDASGFFEGGFHTMDSAWTRPRDAWFLGFVDDICEIMPDFFRKESPPGEFLSRINTLYRHHHRHHLKEI